jgi:hypothetical protein
MANEYFRKVPDFEYVNRLPNSKIGDYIQVKNFFKRGKIRPDIFQNLMFFEKYKIVGDDRPDNVAYEFYGDANLDWIVLISNNILNIQTEWPLTQTLFDTYLFEKYKVVGDTETDTYNRIYNGIHHYETTRATNSSGAILVKEGLMVDENYSLTYYDELISAYSTTYPVTPITNYEYEEKIEDNKRNIFLLKTRYLNVIIDDMDDIMKYKKGSGQFKTETLKTADNIRLYS